MNPFDGMTLQKIAAAVGVSVDTAHRVSRDTELSDIGIENERGQMRPMHYAARARRDAGTPGFHFASHRDALRVRGRDVTLGTNHDQKIDQGKMHYACAGAT